jgi:hypothetical protein
MQNFASNQKLKSLTSIKQSSEKMAVTKTKAIELVFVEAEIQRPNVNHPQYDLLMSPSVQEAFELVKNYVEMGTAISTRRIDLPWYEVFQRAAELQQAQYGRVDFGECIDVYFKNLYKKDEARTFTEQDRIPNAVVLLQSRTKIF